MGCCFACRQRKRGKRARGKQRQTTPKATRDKKKRRIGCMDGAHERRTTTTRRQNNRSHARFLWPLFLLLSFFCFSPLPSFPSPLPSSTLPVPNHLALLRQRAPVAPRALRVHPAPQRRVKRRPPPPLLPLPLPISPLFPSLPLLPGSGGGGRGGEDGRHGPLGPAPTAAAAAGARAVGDGFEGPGRGGLGKHGVDGRRGRRRGWGRSRFLLVLVFHRCALLFFLLLLLLLGSWSW